MAASICRVTMNFFACEQHTFSLHVLCCTKLDGLPGHAAAPTHPLRVTSAPSRKQSCCPVRASLTHKQRCCPQMHSAIAQPEMSHWSLPGMQLAPHEAQASATLTRWPACSMCACANCARLCCTAGCSSSACANLARAVQELLGLFSWLQDLEAAHECVVDAHNCPSVVKLAAVVGR